MGRERTSNSGVNLALTTQKGIELHGNHLRIIFMWKRKRYRQSLGLLPTKANIKHATQLRAAILHEIKIGTFEFGRHFPESLEAKKSGGKKNDEHMGVLLERYKPLKAVDLTTMTERKYAIALDACIELIGRKRSSIALLPEDIQLLRLQLIKTRAPSTANHYLATLSGFLAWCESNGYIGTGIASACRRFAMSTKDPDPLTKEDFNLLIHKGCLHPQDSAAITLAVYSGLRPGELCGLAIEDIDLIKGCLTVKRAITAAGDFKVPKTEKPRTVLLMPPAIEACKILIGLAENNPPVKISVFQNRHESRVERVIPLLSPSTQARKEMINSWFTPTAWNTKWAAVQRRSGIRQRRPYQTRHTYACWCLTAHGNLAFIAKQMGHKDFTMLVEVYAKWMDDESPKELENIWRNISKSI